MMPIIPLPEPENFWPFWPGQSRIIAKGPTLTMRLDEIGAVSVHTTITLDDQTSSGEMRMHVTKVIARDRTNTVPLVTVTLRHIADGKAFFQVTGHVSVPLEVCTIDVN